MAYEADRVVVELIAKVDGFDQPVKQSATQFDRSMDQITRSATNAERGVVASSAKRSSAIQRESAQISQFTKPLASDMIGAGNLLVSDRSPFVVPVKSAPAVSKALGLVTSGATLMGGALGGVAVAGGLALLEMFVKLAAGANSEEAQIAALVEKLKEHYQQTQLSEKANRAWLQTYEGASENIDKIVDALDRENRTLEENIALKQNELRANISSDEKARADAVAQLAEKQRLLGVASGPNGGVLDRASIIQDMAEIGRHIDELDAKIVKAQRGIREAVLPLVREQAKALADPLEAISQRYAGLQHDAEQAALGNQDAMRRIVAAFASAGQKVPAELRQIEAALDRLQKKELDAAKAAQKASNSLPAVSGKEIASALGTTITSGTRSAQRNKDVGGAANSYHLTGQAIDIPLTVNGHPLTKAGIRSVLEPLGVEIKELLGPGDKGHDDHFHIAFSKKRLGGDQVASAAARAERQEDQVDSRNANLLAGLNQRYAAALAQLAAGTEESAKARKDAIDKERDAEDQRIAGQLANHQIDEATAKEAKRVNDATAELAKQLVDRAEAERQFRIGAEKRQRDLEVAEGELQNQQEILQGQEGLAQTQAERRDIELRILDLAFQEEALREKAVIAARDALAAKIAELAPDKVSDDQRRELANLDAQATVAQGRLDSAPQRYANSASGIFQSTASPIEEFLKSVPQSADQINEAFETIAANGLNDFAAGLADAAVNAKSLGDLAMSVLKQIEAQLIEMAVKQLFSKALGGLFGGVGGLGGGASAADIGGITSVLNGGSGAFTFAADGGHIRGPGTSTSDSIPAMLSDGEFVVKASAVKQIGVKNLEALNDGRVRLFSDGGVVRRVSPSNDRAMPASAGGGSGGGDVNIYVDAKDAVLARTVQGWIAEGMSRAAVGGSQLARQNLIQESLHRLD